MKPLTGLPVDSLVQVSKESGISLKQLHELVEQLENGASAAFLSRYRADLCGGHGEERVGEIVQRLHDLRDLADRRIAMLATLGQRGVLTDELRTRIECAANRRDLNDLFLPYRARVRDQASEAIDKGLDPLARTLWFQQVDSDIQVEAGKYLAPENGIADVEQALNGACQIAARWLSEKPEILRNLREIYHRDCEISVALKARGLEEPRWRALDGFRAKASEVPWQKRLAIRRGVRTGILESTVELPIAAATDYLRRCLIKDASSAYAPHLERVIEASLKNGLSSRVQKDVLLGIDEQADRDAIHAFCQNLRNALLAAPAHGLSILGIDTSRTGGWAAVLIDDEGKLVDHAIVGPDRGKAPSGSESGAKLDRASAGAESTGTPAASENGTEPPAERQQGELSADATEAGPEAAGVESSGPERATAGGKSGRKPPRTADLSEFLRDHDVDLIVFSSGPKSHSIERFLRAHIRRSGKTRVAWRTVRDFGATQYVLSKFGKRELRHLHPAFRTALTLARRVRDPLAELVKADPKTVGIGFNHQEVDSERLDAALRRTVDCTVHDAGVDANSATVALLARVPGVSAGLARRLVERRERNGPYRTRQDLRQVEGFSDRVFAQAAGFLRVYGEDPFDGTGGHPDYRELYGSIAVAAGCDLPTLLAEPERLDGIEPEQFVTSERSVECVRAAISELSPERRSCRKRFELPNREVPLRTDAELLPGSKVSGVVTSIADFGAFIDIGADKDALLHVSQIVRERVRDSKPALQIGEAIEAFVRTSEQAGKGISLSMRDPASRPHRDRNGSGRSEAYPDRRAQRYDGPRRRDGRGSQRGDRRTPYRQTFGPDTERPRRESRATGKLSRQEKLDMLQDRYRTKV